MKPIASAPRIDIRGRTVTIDPSWKNLVRRKAAVWRRRHMDFARLRVTIVRGRHHRQGLETVSVHASLTGRTLHATKRAETLDAAMRGALEAIGRELETPRRRTRTVTVRGS